MRHDVHILNVAAHPVLLTTCALWYALDVTVEQALDKALDSTFDDATCQQVSQST